MNKQPSQWFKSGKSEDLNVCIYVHTVFIYTQTIYTSYYFHIGIPFSKHITRKSMQTWNNFCSFAHSSNQIHVPKTVPLVLPALPCCTNRLIPKRQMKMSWWFETYWPNWIISPRKGVKIPKKMFELLPPRKLADMDWTLRAPISANRQRTSNFPPQKIKNTHTKQTSSKLTDFFLLPAKNEILGCRFSLSNKAWFNLTRLHQVSSCSPPVSFPKKMDGS